MTKYIIITGGVVSGLGKGITAASIGRLLKDRGYKVTAIKIDPYLNIDCGTMRPAEHGEIFILRDGTEVDLDLGNYERFLDIELIGEHNITTGKVYKTVIEKERRGDYLGQTVQIIPHITNEIKDRIRNVAERCNVDICLVEVGGTVSDIESMIYLEAIRQLRREENPEDTAIIHVTLVPINTQGEQKTKPTQHSVKELRSAGLQPDIIVGRCEYPLTLDTKKKISLFCDVPVKAVISAENIDNLYKIPLVLEDDGIIDYLRQRLSLNRAHKHSFLWRDMVASIDNFESSVKVAIVGKYTQLSDSYLSIYEALRHAGIANKCNVDIELFDAESITLKDLKETDGIIVPGGFGVRGTEGKMNAIKFARENNIPFLGLCLGMQLAVIEFARNVLGLEGANSTELCKSNCKHPVIDLLPEQNGISNLGGTMRLGDYKTIIKKDTLAYRIYEKTEIVERHRHRYEVNPSYVEQIERAGMIFSGRDDKGIRMEIAEIPTHRFFIGTQFHPEFKSRPLKPHPIFKKFIEEIYLIPNI